MTSQSDRENMIIKLPVINNNPTTKTPSNCTNCDQKLGKQEYWIMCGALKETKNSASMSSDLLGFLSLSAHGEINASIEIVKNGSNGQSDIPFCSKKCMTNFWMKCINMLPEK